MNVYRRTHLFLLSIAVAFGAHNGAEAMYASPVAEVPLERLVENTQAYIDSHPEEPRGYYIMARLYANAWIRDESALKCWELGSADELVQFEDIGASYGGAARMGNEEETGPTDYFHKALDYYGDAIARIPENNDTDDYWNRVILLGYAWIHEEGAKRTEVLGVPPHDDTLADVSDADRTHLREAIAAYDGNPKSGAGKQLFADRDAALSVAASLEPSDPAHPGAMRFARQVWILDAITYNTKILNLTPEPPGAVSEFLAWIGVKERVYNGYDQILAEACQGIAAAAAIDEALSDQLSNIVSRATQRAKINNAQPRAITPIVLSLEPDRRFTDLIAPKTTVRFDLNGDGFVESWPWVNGDTGLLVWIGDGTNPVTSGRDLIGSRTWYVFWKDGYEPLQFLDDNRDGWLRGDELRGLGLWFDRNGDAVANLGEVAAVTHSGITGVNTRSTGRDRGTLVSAQGIELSDGTVLPTWDWEPRENRR